MSKPTCPSCGSSVTDRSDRDYQELRQCPYCGVDKCALCDLGDDVECLSCDIDLECCMCDAEIDQPQLAAMTQRAEAAEAECRRLLKLVNNPHTEEFLASVKLEAAYQRQKFGDAHDRNKSAENWFWLVGYLAGKCLRSVIIGDVHKALHHTISSGAALANWYEAIKRDTTGAGLGADNDMRPLGQEGATA